MYQCCKFCLVWGPAWYNPNTSRVWLWEAFLWASAPLCIVRFCAIKVLHLLVAFLVWDTWRMFMSFRRFRCERAYRCEGDGDCHCQHPDSSNGPWTSMDQFYMFLPYSTDVPKQQGTNAVHPLRCDHLFANRCRPSQASTGDLSHLDVSIHDALGGCRQVF